MPTSSFADWMRRPLSSAVCPTPDIWPETPYREPGPKRKQRNRQSRRSRHGSTGHITAYVGMDAKSARRQFMNEEKERILKMVEDGKISATDAIKLIEALERSDSRPSDRELRKKWVHIRVDKDGERNVDVKLPLSLLKFGFNFIPGGGKHARVMARARRGHRHAERARERAERMRERREAKAEKLRERLEEKLGPEVDFDIGATVQEAVQEAMADMEEAMPDVAELTGVNGMDQLKNLDLDEILKMAQQDGFDGKILEVHDDEDDEHVVITLE